VIMDRIASMRLVSSDPAKTDWVARSVRTGPYMRWVEAITTFLVLSVAMCNRLNQALCW